MVAMPRDGAIIFSDLIGKLDLLRVACEKCGRDGCYGLSGSSISVAAMAKVVDGSMNDRRLPEEAARNLNDPCGARCRDLARVL